MPFQFHKVQLKASRTAGGDLKLHRFQFHKVQLKARRVQINATRTTQFQFHKVQLKVYRIICLICKVFVSIP